VEYGNQGTNRLQLLEATFHISIGKLSRRGFIQPPIWLDYDYDYDYYVGIKRKVKKVHVAQWGQLDVALGWLLCDW
jgi:hypothetical protein